MRHHIIVSFEITPHTASLQAGFIAQCRRYTLKSLSKMEFCVEFFFFASSHPLSRSSKFRSHVSSNEITKLLLPKNNNQLCFNCCTLMDYQLSDVKEEQKTCSNENLHEWIVKSCIVIILMAISRSENCFNGRYHFIHFVSDGETFYIHL